MLSLYASWSAYADDSCSPGNFMKTFRVFLALAVLAIRALAVETAIVTWPTKSASPPVVFPQEQSQLLPLVRFGVAAFPEAMVMQMTFVGASALGLSDASAAKLHQLVTAKYDTISRDPVFSKLPSALPYCYAPKQPETGQALIVIPERLTEDTTTIVFLHGSGGSFTFYAHFLANAFPDCLVVCPAYGETCGNIPTRYLEECRDAVAKRTGLRPRMAPILIGLSGGGFGGFREYCRNSRTYSGYICIAAYPPSSTLGSLPQRGHIRLIAGGAEPYVVDGTLGRGEVLLRRRVGDYDSHLVAGEDHFFLLSKEEETQAFLQKWVSEFRKGAEVREQRK